MYKNQYLPFGRFLYIDFLALLSGIFGGAIAIWFLYIIKVAHGLIFGSDTLAIAENFEWWRIVLPLLLAGLLAGVVAGYMRYKRPFGVAGVVEACALRNGHLSLKEGLLNGLLHKMTLCLGASSGREGPAIHLAVSLLTPLLIKLRVSSHYHVLLVGCVVAGAIGASFNTALAGALFAWEVVVGRGGRVHYVLPLTIGGGGGLLLSYLIYGEQGAFYIPQLLHNDMISTAWVYPAMILFGISIGLIGGCFVTLTTWIYEFTERKKISALYRTMIGGVLLALIAVNYPFVLGVGYDNIYLQLFGNPAVLTIIAIFAIKLLASVTTIGFGLGGGVWTLCLIFGGIYGTISGNIFDNLLHSDTNHQLLFMVVGMAGFIASILGAPLTGILFVIEHNGQFEIVFATLLAVVFTTQTVSVVFSNSFYSQTLRQAMGGNWWKVRRNQYQFELSDLIEPATTIDGQQHLSEAYKLLAGKDKDEQSILFVTDDEHDSRFIGIIGWQHLSRYQPDENKSCFDVMGINRNALPSDDLSQIWELLELNTDPALPVVDVNGKITGCIKRVKILQAMQTHTMQSHTADMR